MNDIKTISDEYVMGTYARFPITILKGKNSILFDEDGKEYVDFTSGIGVNSLGYGDEDWVRAVSEQAGVLAHTSNIFYTKPQSLLAESLVKLSGMSKVFFSNSGAEANEGGIKLARKYSFDKYGKDRANIITLVNSFHGRTISTLKATGQSKFHDFFFPFTEGFIYAEANDFEDVLSKTDETVCAIILESIQGEGGVMPLDESFVKNISKLCKEKDILLMFDEVQTGMGRTGKLFGFNNYDAKPDIVTIAKGLGGGLPIGAVICNEKLKDTLSAGHHGSTYGGNPICCEASRVVLEKVCNDKFLLEVLEKGNYIVNEIKGFNSKVVKEVRGKGLMIGVVLDTESPKEFVLRGIEMGLLTLTAGKDVLRLLPPLTITYEEIDKGLDILKKILV